MAEEGIVVLGATELNRTMRALADDLSDMHDPANRGAQTLLAQADLRKGRAPFGRLDVELTAPSDNEIRYAASGTFATIDCRAKLTAVGERGIDVATDCSRTAPSDGAAAGTGAAITRIAFAEYVASVLGKRPYNDAKVSNASAGAVFKNLGTMQKDALKMQRDMQKSIDEGNAASADDEPADYDAGEYNDPGTVADSGAD